jgi:hypothetical protein
MVGFYIDTKGHDLLPIFLLPHLYATMLAAR